MKKTKFIKIFESLVWLIIGTSLFKTLLLTMLNTDDNVARLIIAVIIFLPIVFFFIGLKGIIDIYFRYKLSNAKEQKIKETINMVYAKVPVVVFIIVWFLSLIVMDYFIITAKLNGNNWTILLFTLIFWIFGFVVVKKVLKRKNL